MWTAEQRQRIALEHAILQQEGFSQFSVYWDRTTDTYSASGVTFSNSGHRYGLYIHIPSGFPSQRPSLYLTEPFPLLMSDGRLLSSLGVSHGMHTLAPSSNGLSPNLPLARRPLAFQYPPSEGILEGAPVDRGVRTAPRNRPTNRRLRSNNGRKIMNSTDPQQQMIRDAMKAIAERKPGHTKLVYDKSKRTIVAVSDNAETPRALNITADDADMFAIATISSRWLQDQWPLIKGNSIASLRFSCWDGGDAFTQFDLGRLPSPMIVAGAVVLGNGTAPSDENQLRVVLTPGDASSSHPSTFVAPDGLAYQATGWLKVTGKDEPIDINIIDVQPALATRRASILETDVLRTKSVLCIGLGTGGAHVAIELAKCGVGRFMLVDRDRLSVGNVGRHPGGVSQVGRFKVNVMRDLICEKNPDAEVSAHPVELTYENAETIKQLITQASVVICATDNRPSKLIVNRLCIEADKVALYGGAFRRAYGGQVLCVRPKRSPCHECFVAAMPDESSDVEISSNSDAAQVAYSDRPVAIEPGLSLDVLPIANMLAKLALLQLLSEEQTSLAILKRDFDAPWYLWLNRPEPGTQYASWPPLSESSDEMTINRWYGIYFDRDPACPACGDFLSSVATSYGLDLASLGELPSVPPKE